MGCIYSKGPDVFSYYESMEVARSASMHSITERFRSLVWECTNSANSVTNKTIRLQYLWDMYRVLRSYSSRGKYDRSMGIPEIRDWLSEGPNVYGYPLSKDTVACAAGTQMHRLFINSKKKLGISSDADNDTIHMDRCMFEGLWADTDRQLAIILLDYGVPTDGLGDPTPSYSEYVWDPDPADDNHYGTLGISPDSCADIVWEMFCCRVSNVMLEYEKESKFIGPRLKALCYCYIKLRKPQSRREYDRTTGIEKSGEWSETWAADGDTRACYMGYPADEHDVFLLPMTPMHLFAWTNMVRLNIVPSPKSTQEIAIPRILFRSIRKTIDDATIDTLYRYTEWPAMVITAFTSN